MTEDGPALTPAGIVSSVEVPAGARWSHLEITCRRHPDVVVLELSTYDGAASFFSSSTGSHDEYEGYLPTAAELEGISRVPGLGTAITAPRPGDVAHWRWVLRCDRPGCGYRYELRHDTEPLTGFLFALWHRGVASFTIADLDTWTAQTAARRGGGR